MKGGPVTSCNVANVNDSFWIVGINVKNRGVDNSTNICAVRRGTTVARICGEANLNNHAAY